MAAPCNPLDEDTSNCPRFTRRKVRFGVQRLPSSGAENLRAAFAACAFGALCASSALGQTREESTANPPWQAGAFRHVEEMRIYHNPVSGPQRTPLTIPRFEQYVDASGQIGSLNLHGPTRTQSTAFFQDLGRNQRTCFTCHQPQDGWSVSAASAQRRFGASNGKDPLFRVIDGAVCPNADVSSTTEKLKAYQLLLGKGLIRVFIPLPLNRDFEITEIDDPYGCNYKPKHSSSDIVSFYRRPLPTANLGFLSAIMWDGRETSFQQQVIDATKIHAEAADDPTTTQVNDIVDFEMGLFAAQTFDRQAKALDDACAKGGPAELHRGFGDFYRGVNDPLGGNPRGLPFTYQIFDDYTAWRHLGGTTNLQQAREAVERGQKIFNETIITIVNVPGLNDPANPIKGFCGTCHDAPNVGNHSVPAPLNIGVSNAGTQRPPVLDISGLPVFTIKCNSGETSQVTDIGRAMMTGRCKDVGKVKGPILRGLAARAPYFHNGSAATLLDVVNFYDQRFGIGFSEQQKNDLVAFLESL
jgi:cytochrome c peroxidase